MKILFFYESHCGGETIATEAIIKELSQKAIVVRQLLQPLQKTDTLSFFSWIIHGIIRSFITISQQKDLNWVYTTTFTAGVAAALLKPFIHFQLAWHFHGSRIPPKPHTFFGKSCITQYIKWASVKIFHQLFLSHVNIIFVPTHAAAEELKQEFSFLNHKKIIVISNGVDLHEFASVTQKQKIKLRQKFGFKKEDKVILSIGRLDPYKNLYLLLDVISLMSKKLPQVKLLIACPPPHKNEKTYQKLLVNNIHNLHLTHLVKWQMAPPNIADVYHVSDLVVSLSQNERFPLILLESLAAKTLFAGSRMWSQDFLSRISRKLLINAINPQTIAKQLRSILMESPALQNKWRHLGYQLVKQYTWINTTESIYSTLLTI